MRKASGYLTALFVILGLAAGDAAWAGKRRYEDVDWSEFYEQKSDSRPSIASNETAEETKVSRKAKKTKAGKKGKAKLAKGKKKGKGKRAARKAGRRR